MHRVLCHALYTLPSLPWKVKDLVIWTWNQWREAGSDIDFAIQGVVRSPAACFTQKLFRNAESQFFARVLSCIWLSATPWTVSPPGFPVHGIPQARILEWVAMPSSRGSSWRRDRISLLHWQADFLPLSHLGSSAGSQIPPKPAEWESVF